MSEESVMLIEEFNAAIEWQADHADAGGAPCTARVIRALPKVRAGHTETGRRMANWPGLTLKDAMPLRIAGGFHHLVLSGRDDRLARVYSGELTDQDAIDELVCELVETYDEELSPWLDGPPQTNEAGRAASIMAGLLWLGTMVSPRFELFELGASAGVLTMLDRYFFRLGDTAVGPESSPMQIRPEWRSHSGSPPPPSEEFEIVSVRGCDVAPIDLSDPNSALRLKSYVWPDAPARLARIDAAIALAGKSPPDVVKQDAGAFVEECLGQPHEVGTTRTMFHSIMWQYMPDETKDRITRAFEQAGLDATTERPIAWVSLETDPATFRHELKVRCWNGETQNGEEVLLSHAHPHGAWVDWAGA